jgi:hypothetical protein
MELRTPWIIVIATAGPLFITETLSPEAIALCESLTNLFDTPAKMGSRYFVL